MRIVITGASGFVARQIIPKLRRTHDDLLLVGRDVGKLALMYPELQVCDYTQLPNNCAGADILLHLAVMNNDVGEDPAAFRAANVDLLDQVVKVAQEGGVKHLIYVSTLHVQRHGVQTPYARSKAEAEALLADLPDGFVTTLRLAAVHGTELRGNLKRIESLPTPLRKSAFALLSALRPTTHADLVADAVLGACRTQLGGTQIVTDAQQGNRIFAGVKRLIDICFALVVIGVFWWLLALTWLAVKVSSAGAGILSQERIGRHGKPFICYKFRTMYTGTRQAGTHEITSGSVTRVGAVLRKTKLDELPQVVNILKNELSLVGPRPCLPSQLALIAARNARHILDMKPGISGWAQIHNIDMSDPERLAIMDEEYKYLRSLPMELRIIAATAFGNGQGDKIKTD
jgi:lipopolysaccharide/colanic/teichoic acid biosynthesis glycosyltransferase